MQTQLSATATQQSLSNYVYDPSTGYYFDSTTGLYYDANTQVCVKLFCASFSGDYDVLFVKNS